MVKSAIIHRPVLLKEAVELLAIIPGNRYIDATVGAAGHAAEIVKKGGSLLGIDLDPKMIAIAKTHLKTVCPDGDWHLSQGNFAEIEKIASKNNFLPVDGIIFDLGLASHHYLKEKRGFSFNDAAPLDMRISGQGLMAADLLAKASEKELIEIFTKFGQERFAPQIARAIVKKRPGRMSAAELGKMIKRVYRSQTVFDRKRNMTRIHPATKVFLSLRIWTNREFENLQKGLRGSFKILKKGGRLAIISFHSGEDRLVKKYFKNLVEQGIALSLTKRPVFPSSKELKINRRARSAVLRAIEKNN